MTKEDTNFEATGKLAAATCFLVFAVMVGGFTVSVLWSWFICPVFEIRQLRLPEAIGLMIFASAFRSWKKADEDADLWELCKRQFPKVVGQVVVLLGCGYIVHLFI